MGRMPVDAVAAPDERRHRKKRPSEGERDISLLSRFRRGGGYSIVLPSRQPVKRSTNYHPLATLVAMSLLYSPSAAAAARTAGKRAALFSRANRAAVANAARRTEATLLETAPSATAARLAREKRAALLPAVRAAAAALGEYRSDMATSVASGW